MTIRRSAAVILCIVLLGACGADGGSASGPPPSLAEVTTTDPKYAGTPVDLEEDDIDPADLAQVTLVDAGSEPRRELRLTATSGTTQLVSYTVDTTTMASVDGRAEPSLRMVLEVGISHTVVDDDEDTITVVSVLEEVALLDASDAMLDDGIDEIRAEMVGAQYRVELDRRGVTRRAWQPSTSGRDEWSVSPPLEAVSLALPVEPVGAGAVWEVREVDDRMGGEPIEIVSVVTLTELRDGEVVVDVVQDSPVVTGPQRFQGRRINMIGGQIGGPGTRTWRADLPMPWGTQRWSGERILVWSGQEIVQTIDESYEVRPR